MLTGSNNNPLIHTVSLEQGHKFQFMFHLEMYNVREKEVMSHVSVPISTARSREQDGSHDSSGDPVCKMCVSQRQPEVCVCVSELLLGVRG